MRSRNLAAIALGGFAVAAAAPVQQAKPATPLELELTSKSAGG